MKRCVFLYIAIGICLTGCTQYEKSNEMKITPTLTTNAEVKQVSIKEMPFTIEENTEKGYLLKKEVVIAEEIATAVEILENANWEVRSSSMANPPDFRIKLDSFNYAIWVTPFGDRLEIIVEGELKYVKLPSTESEILYEIITGESL